MTLGERICAQRTAHHLSQTDLADALGVSRQSVSKWETDASVPDLDKLVKMCELFETSLDQLVRGAEPTADLSQPTVVIQRENSRRDVRTIIGLILIVFGLLCFMLVFFLKGWGLDDALVYSVPFWVWGWLTLRCKKHPVLACFWGTWGMYTGLLAFFRVGYGLSNPAVNLFIPPNLLMLSLLSAATAWIRKQGVDERKE